MCKGKKSTVWNENSLQFLKDHYSTMPNNQLADILGITRVYVSRKASQLGLVKESRCWKLTRHVKDAIIRMYPDNSYQSIADKLHISADAVYKYINQLFRIDPTFSKRTKKETGRIISAYRVRLIKSERGYAAFGLEQKTRLHLYRSKKRNNMRAYLRKNGSYEIDHGSFEVYIIDEDRRDKDLENKAVELGFEFYSAIGEEGDQIIYEQIM